MKMQLGSKVLTILEGKVIEGELVSIQNRVEGGQHLYDGCKFFHDGRTLQFGKSQKFYSSLEDIKNNCPLEGCSLDGRRIAPKTCYYLDGEVIQIYDFNSRVELFEYLSDGTGIVLRGWSPEKWYHTKESAYAFNDIPIHQIDGSVNVNPGKGKVLLLNDEQRKLRDEYVNLMKRMEEANMLILADYSYQCEFVINKPPHPDPDWYDCGADNGLYTFELPEELKVSINNLWNINEEFCFIL